MYYGIRGIKRCKVDFTTFIYKVSGDVVLPYLPLPHPFEKIVLGSSTSSFHSLLQNFD